MDIGGTCTGIYRLNTEEVVMIDTGSDYCPELFAWLNRNRLCVRGIIHTHLHIDHIGNTVELVSKYNCDAFACSKEPIYQGETGPYPNCEIQWNEPDTSVVIDGVDGVPFGGTEFKTVFTPGHSSGHQLIITPDGVCFLGDILLTGDVLGKSKFPYQEKTGDYLHSLETVGDTDYMIYVASHGGLVERSKLNALIELNAEKHRELYRLIKETANEAGQGDLTMDELADLSMRAAGVTNPAVRNVGWMQESVRHRIQELIEKGKIRLT